MTVKGEGEGKGEGKGEGAGEGKGEGGHARDLRKGLGADGKAMHAALAVTRDGL